MDEEKFVMEIKEAASPGETEAIDEGLREFNEQFSEADNHQKLVIVLRDEKGKLAGGLLGDTAWRWLHIGTLWIRADLRHLGYGCKLMVAAEQEAIRRGCLHSHLETHDFQALGFYQKNGYSVYGQLNDFPPKHVKFFLKKELR